MVVRGFSLIRRLVDLFRTWREHNRALKAIAGLNIKPMPIEDALCLAAVAAELGVGVQEAKDGTWRQRFSVVDVP